MKQLTADARNRLRTMNTKRTHQVTERMIVNTLAEQEIVSYSSPEGTWSFDVYDLIELTALTHNKL